MPPHELITNNRWTPSTSAHAAGLLESISAGRSSRGADTSRAVGVRAGCAARTEIARHEAAKLLEMRDKLLEDVICRHIGLQRRDRHIAGFYGFMVRSPAIRVVFVECLLDPVIGIASRIGARVDLCHV